MKTIMPITARLLTHLKAHAEQYTGNLSPESVDNAVNTKATHLVIHGIRLI